MSTLDDLDAAVRAHVAEEHPGQLVIGWALVTAATTQDDAATDYDTVSPDSAPAHHTLGLFDVGAQLIREQKEEE